MVSKFNVFFMSTLVLLGIMSVDKFLAAAKKLILWCFSRFRRTVVSIPNGPSALAVKEAAWGLARYAAISQV